MVRKRRSYHEETQLQKFLVALFKEERLTARSAAKIAGCSASAISDWKRGAYPAAETIPALKRFCNHFGFSLTYALTGESDSIKSEPAKPTATNLALGSEQPIQLEGFLEEHLFNGLCRVQITRVLPHRKSEDKKEPG